MRTLASIALAVALAATGCSKAGMGASVRTDIAARMQTITAPVQTCYAAALARNRRLAGVIVLSFRAAPGSGQFEQVAVLRDEVGDPQVQTCVVEAVGKLKLETPQKTAVTVEYPLDFRPSN